MILSISIIHFIIRRKKGKAAYTNFQKDENVRRELFNLENDISDENNIAKQHHFVTKEVEGILKNTGTLSLHFKN